LEIDLVKTILFLLAAIFPVLLLLQKNPIVHYRNFILNILFIHLVLLIIITFKLHHFLRDTFNIPNTITYLLGAITFIILFTKQKVLLHSQETIFLLISLILLGIAVSLDLLSDGKIFVLDNNDLIEEIFRIAGAFSWLIYNYFLFIKIKKLK
jgi:hypothetical protein